MTIKLTKSLARMALGEHLADIVRTAEGIYRVDIYKTVEGGQVFVDELTHEDRAELPYLAIDYLFSVEKNDTELRIWTIG